MTTKTLRISEQAHERASQLAALRGGSMTTVVSDAIEAAYQIAFWESAGRQVRQMQKTDPAAWKTYQAEAAEWAAADDELAGNDVPEVGTTA